jgi:hypothetical protein
LHPYTGVGAYAFLATFPVIPLVRRTPDFLQARRHFASVAPFLATAPIVLAYAVWARGDPVFRATSGEILSWRAHAGALLWLEAYGFLLPLAVVGLAWGDLGRGRDALVAWLASSLVLAANPLWAGNKFQHLVHAPLAIAAAAGVLALARRLRGPARAPVLAALGVGLFAGFPLTVAHDVAATANERRIFTSRPELDALLALDREPAGNVLASYHTGSRLAWLSGKSVQTGHRFLTVDEPRKSAEVAWFLDSRTPTDAKRAFLAEREIRYIFAGPFEDSIGVVDSAGLGLSTIYEHSGVTIYAVPR